MLLLAAVHYLLLGGLDHVLGAVYAGESDADLGPLFVDLCLRNRDAPGVARHRAGEHQRGGPVCGDRASAHRGGVAAECALGHVDVGCSAGLNLLCDRYRLDYGPAGATGPDGAPVEIRCDVVGSPPIAPALPTISARIGLDRAPLDVHDPDQSRWQLACVWPDTGRLTRTRLALDEARRTPLELVRGDAVEDVGELIASLPRDATAVVTTTWVVAYFSPEQRTGFREALSAASRLVPWRGSARGPRSGRPDPQRRCSVGRERRRVECARPRHLPRGPRRSRAARPRPPARQRSRLASRAPIADAVIEASSARVSSGPAAGRCRRRC